MSGRREWKIVDREFHNDKYDLLHVEITYHGKNKRRILNKYLVLKHEKRVPYELMEERKYGASEPLDGKAWKEGRIRGRRNS